MERRFGKSNIARLVRNYLEEKKNQELISSSTTSCPGCKVRIEKSLGCNHVRVLDVRFNPLILFIFSLGKMTCTKCAVHFCFRCGKRLQPQNPYQHFSTPNTPCFGMLFDQSRGGDGDWVDLGFEDL
jgi:E3 ubiquitin-protein ligase RNF14